MRVPSGISPSQPITHLWERHKEIMRRLVAGDRQVDIAKDMQISQSRMSIICNSPAFVNQLERLSEGANNNALDVAGRVQILSDDAMSVLEDILQQPELTGVTPKLRASVAHDILDRAGHGATKKIASIPATLNGDDIEELKMRWAKIVGTG